MTSEIIYCLLWLFSITTKDNDRDNHLLGYKEGIVENGNFTYFYIYHFGGFIISLKSREGDADMYISESNLFPTYEIDSYDLHSATCGQDFIQISENAKSPIAVGIYGHSAYDMSRFILEVFPTPANKNIGAFVLIDEDLPEPTDVDTVSKEESKIKTTHKAKVKQKSHVSNQITGIFSLFEIIQLIFL